MWLARHHAAVVSALAFVARSRDPLHEGFARLAADDPVLQPWADRLHDDLSSGQPWAAVLRRHRLIGQADAARLASTADAAAAVAELERIAQDQRMPAGGVLLVTWLPLWVTMAALVPAMVIGCIAARVLGLNELYVALNVNLPPMLKPMVDLGAAGPGLIWMLGTIAAVAGFWQLLGMTPGVRFLRVLVFPTIWRQTAVLRLIMLAQRGATPAAHSLRARLERMLVHWPWTVGRQQAWRWEWQAWMGMTWWRLGSRHRASLRALRTDGMLAGDVGAHLVACGVADSASRDALAAALAREEDRLRSMLPSVVRQAWMLIGVASFVGLLVVFIAPLIDIVKQLGQQAMMIDPATVPVLFTDIVWPALTIVVHLVVGLIVVSGKVLLPLIIINAVWAWLRMLTGRQRAWRTAAGVVAHALRTRRPVATGLDACVHAQHTPHARRFHAAAVRIDRGEDLIDALAASRLLPRSRLAAARAAAGLGPDILAAWLAQESSPPAAIGALDLALAWLAVQVIATAAIMTFMTIFIFPKFEMILWDLNTQVPPLLASVIACASTVGDWWWLAVSLVIVGIKGWVWLAPLWDRTVGVLGVTTRRQRGRLILAAAGSGRSEAVIAEAVQATFRRSSPALAQAGRAGDLPGIMAAAGWQVPSLAALSVAVARADAAADRWIRWAGLAVYVSGPVLVAACVGPVVIGVFQALLLIAHALMETP